MYSKFKTMYNMIINNPKKLIRGFGENGLFNWIPDKIYLKMVYYGELNKKLDIKNPKEFTEKLQWLKLNDRKDEYTKFVDKLEVREYIKSTIGEEYLIPIIAVYDRVEDIDWNKLPKKFVLKCTHGSSCNIICSDKSKLDIDLSVKKLNRWMKHNWYWFGREWPYKNVKPRIICEQYMVDDSGRDLKDYKFMCFNGKVKCLFVASERYTGNGVNIDYYDANWNKMNITKEGSINSNKEMKKPYTFEKMIEFSEILSKDIPFVRIDFYEINRKLYFGEITLYPDSGFKQFYPNYYNELLGSWIQLNGEN